MVTPVTKIRQAFYKQLQQFAEDNQFTDIAWPNVKFQPTDKIYIRPSIQYGRTTASSLGENGFELTTGFFQLTLVGAKDTGEKELDELIEQLFNYFKGGVRLIVINDNYLTITNSYRSGLIMEDNRPTVVITANFTIYIPKGL